MKTNFYKIITSLLLVATLGIQAFAGCAPGDTYLLVLINADAYFAGDGTVITVTVGGTVVYMGTPADGLQTAVVDGCFPEGSTVSVDYTDTFGDGIVVNPPAFIQLGCTQEVVLVANGGTINEATAAAGNIFAGTLPVDLNDLASGSTGAGTSIATTNPTINGTGCSSASMNTNVAISPTIPNGTTPPAFPSGVAAYSVCDIAGGNSTGMTLNGTNTSGLSENIEVCGTFVQPNVSGNETGAYVGVAAAPSEFLDSNGDLNGDGNGTNDCGVGIAGLVIYDAACGVISSNITAAGVTGLTPGATYVVCATAFASASYQGADGIVGTADDILDLADGSCALELIGMGVQPFEPTCPAVNPITTSNTVCDGALGTAILDWQAAVEADATNMAAIADANTDVAIVYSTVEVPADAATPNGMTADGVHSDPANTACADETQTTFAYLLCNTDGSYLLLGTHTLTVNSPPQAPSDNIVGCVNTPMRFCGDEGFGTTATNATGGANVANWIGTTYTAQPGDLAGTVDIEVTPISACAPSTFTITTPACPAECPAVSLVDNGATICDGDLLNEITDWQADVAANAANAAAIADANTAGVIEYSTVAATPPNGLTATGVYAGADPCGAAEVQPTFAYLLCFGPDATQGTADDTYLELGTYDLTVNPNTQTPPTPAADACTITLVPVCTADIMAATATVTGDADAANFDAATGTYTAQPGDGAGTIEITVTNSVACNPVTVVLQTPACLASCPAVAAENDAATVCDGGLGTEIMTWQAAVVANATNAAAIADVNTAAVVEYSTVIGTPDGNTATGVFGGADACATDDQLTYAYLLCFGEDATQGTADDTFILLGTHTLTVQPSTQTPADPAPTGCTVTLVGQCANETFAAVAASETGGAAAANFDAATGTYTAQPGDIAGTINITVTNAFSCNPTTYTLSTPLCSASCPAVAAVPGTATVCDGGLGTEIMTWQAAVVADATNAAAIADVNTAAAVEYSTVIGTPDGNTATGVFGGADACAIDDQLTYAYLLCFGEDATQGTADDTFILLGTHTLTVQPSTQAPADPAPTGCTVTLVGQCANETFAAVAASETGGAAAANFDAATGTYTAQPGDIAGTINITVTNAFSCNPTTYTLSTPLCSASCPAVAAVPGTATVCDGGLGTEIMTWQAAVVADATNAAAIADVNTAAAVEYSTVMGTPDGNTATGVFSGADACAIDDQLTYAYLLCFGEDATQGTADDTFILLGTHTLTVQPSTQAPADPAPTGCTVTLVGQCANETFAAVAASETGDAAAANFDAATGTYTAQPADAAGTIEVTVTNTFGCNPTTYTLATPACPDAGICEITPAQATNILCFDNNTPADPNDDTYTFDIMVNGSNTQVGAGGTFTDDQGALSSLNGAVAAYGAIVSYGPYAISAGNITVTFTDVDDPTNCTNTMMAAAPMTCSTQMTGIDISDPCSCDAPIAACVAPIYPYTGGTNVPGNIDVDGDGNITNNGMDLVADVIEIVVNNPIAGEMFTVAAAGTAVNCDGTPILIGDTMTETASGSGVYQLVVYYPADGTGYGMITFDGDMGSPSASISNPSAEYMPCVCEPCEDAIAGSITLADCDFSNAMINIFDASGALIAGAPVPVDAMGNYELAGPFACGTYTAEIVNAPACYTDAEGDLNPRTFTIDGDGTPDGFNFMVVPANIPTVGEWGLIMLGLLMSIIAIAGIRQRREEENQVWS